MPLAVALGPDASGVEVFLGYKAWCPALVPIANVSPLQTKNQARARGWTRKGGVRYVPCPWGALCKTQDDAEALLASHLSQHRGPLHRMREGEW